MSDAHAALDEIMHRWEIWWRTACNSKTTREERERAKADWQAAIETVSPDWFAGEERSGR